MENNLDVATFISDKHLSGNSAAARNTTPMAKRPTGGAMGRGGIMKGPPGQAVPGRARAGATTPGRVPGMPIRPNAPRAPRMPVKLPETDAEASPQQEKTTALHVIEQKR